MEYTPGKVIWPRIVGIVGGLGPRAHIEFESRLMANVARRLGNDRVEQDYPSWLLASIPATPDRTKAIVGSGPSPVPGILRALDLLDRTDFAVIPCVTAHAFFDEIATRCSLPLVNLIEETLEFAATRAGTFADPPMVGLLATTGTLRSGVFQRTRIQNSGIRVVTPQDLDAKAGLAWQESVVMGTIYGRDAGRPDLGGGVKSGSHETPAIRERMIAELESVLGEYIARGIRVVIMGCTELSILASDLRTDAELVDPLTVGSEAVLDLASGVRAVASLLRHPSSGG